MKKICYILTLALILTQGTGCKKFLDSQPYSNTSIDQFYQTKDDAELAISGCYNVLNAFRIQDANFGGQGGLYFMQLWIMLTGSTDEALTSFRGTAANPQPFSDAENAPWGYASWSPSSIYTQQVWFFFYAGIVRCNTLLERIDGITGLTPARKTEIIGEARFLRGFFYMYLGMMYGGVPVSTASNPDVNAPRANTQAVFTQVYDDLNFAYTNLPNRSAIQGRASKWSAAGMLAKAYAFTASCKINNVNADLSFPLNDYTWADAPGNYAKVQTITTDIINNSGYKLTAAYTNLFREVNANAAADECLFVATGSTNPANPVWINMQNGFIPQGNLALLGGGVARLQPVGELWYKYQNPAGLSLDTRRANNLTGSLNAANAKETIDNAVYYAPNAVTAATIKNNATYYGGKFRMIDPATKIITQNYWSGNYPIMRLAEIYLLRAEAIYYQNTANVAIARNDLITVRARSVLAANLATVNAAYLKADFIAELLDERTRELCFEAMRHLDLTRFGRYTATINALTTDQSLAFENLNGATLKNNWKPARIWFPVPANELIVNPNLVQNPGY